MGVAQFDALRGMSMPQGALLQASMGPGPGGGVRPPQGTPESLPPPQSDPQPFGGPAMNSGVADPNAGASIPPDAYAGAAPPLPSGGGQVGVPDQGAAAPAGAPASGGAPVPHVPQYYSDSQEDGTILLGLLKGDGSKGPVLKVIPAPPMPKPPAGGAGSPAGGPPQGR